jgi:hypothetical protein
LRSAHSTAGSRHCASRSCHGRSSQRQRRRADAAERRRVARRAGIGWTLAIALKAAQEALLVSNEELIFRGYGLDTLRAAFGLPVALAISVPLFARYHGPGWKPFLGLSTVGLFLAFLRLGTGNLWLAAVFHYGWNIAQKSIFGPEDSAPSLRPLRQGGEQQ